METPLLEKFKKILENKKREISEELQSAAARNKTEPDERIGKYRSDDADSGSEAEDSRAEEVQDYASSSQIIKNLSQKLAEIDLALDKIKSGSYEKCENCGKEISPDRLDALPETRLCCDCEPC